MKVCVSNSPFPDCYCSRMNSQFVEKAIKFCSGNYEECDIYKNKWVNAEASPIVLSF